MMTKKDIRNQFLEKRKSLGVSEADKNLKEIMTLLFSRLMIHRYSPIHIYLPIIKNMEPDTTKIIDLLLKDFSPEIYISKCVENGELEHFLYKKGMPLKENKWNIPEPVGQGLSSEAFFKAFEKEDILVITPLVAFNKNGHRVGYGKGYYDRFLEHATPDTTVIGLSFLEPFSEELAFNKQDIPLNYCFTPKKVWTFKK